MHKISIITVCYNAARSINQTISSVRNQTYPEIEYIIVDGKSSDSTIDIISKNMDLVSKFISEPDKGIYNAMNKGIRAATGEILFFLNADDCFCDERVIEDVVTCFLNNPEIGLVYGNVLFESPCGLSRWIQIPEFKRKPLARRTISHQSIFARIGLFEQTGGFSEEYEIVSDYDWLIKLVHRDINALSIERDITVIGTAGVSNTSQWEFERLKAMQAHYSLLEILLWRIIPHQTERLSKALLFQFRNAKQALLRLTRIRILP